MKTYSRKRPVKLKELNGICRLCLCSDGSRWCIFKDEDDIPLSVKIMTCTSVQVSEGDGMPSEICYNCLHQLESSYKFRRKCEEADAKLRRMLGTTKDVEASEEEFHESNFVTVKNNLCELQTYKSTEVGKLSSSLNPSNAVLILSDTFSVSETYCIDSSESIANDCKSSCNSVCDLLIQNIPKRECNSLQEEVAAPESALKTTKKQQSNNTLNKRENWHGNKDHPHMGRLDDTFSQLDNENNFQNSFELPGNLQSTDKSEIGNQSITFSPTLNNKQTETQCLANKKTDFEHVMKNFGNGSQDLSFTGHYGTESNCTLIFKCDKCPKRFSKRIDLKRHTSIHIQQRGFVCELCEKWCPNQTNLKRHKRTHTGERPFSCIYCSKSFSQTAILNRHMKIHTGEKPFQCDTCGKKFSQKDNLKAHLRQHLSCDDGMTYHYKCPFCEKSFCHQSGLSRHLMTHTGKTFSCDLCPKTFTDQSSLKRHCKRHFEIKSC